MSTELKFTKAVGTVNVAQLAVEVFASIAKALVKVNADSIPDGKIRFPDEDGKLVLFFNDTLSAGDTTTVTTTVTNHVASVNVDAESVGYDRDPTLDDDTTRGFRVLQKWYNRNNGKIFQCFNNETGGAKWKTIFSPGFGFESVINPPELTEDQDDYNPTGLHSSTRVNITSDSNVKITGLDAVGENDGCLKVLTNNNTSNSNITLRKDNGASDVENRFDFTNDIIIKPGQNKMIIYTTSRNRWTEFI